MLVVQLPSQELYRDWELTLRGELTGWPDGPVLAPLDHPIFDASAEEQLRRADPHNFDVEYNAQWATSVSAYLQAHDINAAFAPWAGSLLPMRSQGALGTRYVAHADPSVSGANFAVMVAHREQDDAGRGHLIVDHIHVWRPDDFPDGRIDYEHITAELERLIVRFRLAALTLDQFNFAGLMPQLQAAARANGMGTTIGQRTATERLNTQMAETLKTSLNRNLIHLPHHELLEAELRHLEIRNGRVDHPTRGPVQTSDVADCLMNLVHALIGDNNDHQVVADLARTAIRGSRQAHPLDDQVDAVHRHGTHGSQGGTPRGWDPGHGHGGRPRWGAP